MAAGVHDLAPSRLSCMPSWLVARAAAIARRHVAEALATADARELHYLILATLEEVGPVHASVLARDTGLDRGAVVATVGILSRRRYVQRVGDPTDRRRAVISLTPAGRQELRRLDQLLAHAQARLLDALSNRERAQLIRLLTVVVARQTPALTARE